MPDTLCERLRIVDQTGIIQWTKSLKPVSAGLKKVSICRHNPASRSLIFLLKMH